MRSNEVQILQFRCRFYEVSTILDCARVRPPRWGDAQIGERHPIQPTEPLVIKYVLGTAPTVAQPLLHLYLRCAGEKMQCNAGVERGVADQERWEPRRRD